MSNHICKYRLCVQNSAPEVTNSLETIPADQKTADDAGYDLTWKQVGEFFSGLYINRCQPNPESENQAAGNSSSTYTLFTAEKTESDSQTAEYYNAICIDIDKSSCSFIDALWNLGNLKLNYLVCKTYSNTGSLSGYRIIIPLNESVSDLELLEEVSECFIKLFLQSCRMSGIPVSRKNPVLKSASREQLIHIPVVKDGSDPVYSYEINKDPLHWKKLLDSPGEIFALAPVTGTRSDIPGYEKAKAAEGLPGALARAYTIDEGLKHFLTLYEPVDISSDFPHSYRHKYYTSSAGLKVLNEGWAYSYHRNSDPVAVTQKYASLYELLLANLCDECGRNIFLDEYAGYTDPSTQGSSFIPERFNAFLLRDPRVAAEFAHLDQTEESRMKDEPDNGITADLFSWYAEHPEDLPPSLKKKDNPKINWAVKELSNSSQEDNSIIYPPISTGIPALDEALDDGFYVHEITYMAAMSSLGKTSSMMDIGQRICEQLGIDVFLFEMESDKQTVQAKLYSAQSARNAIERNRTLGNKNLLEGAGSARDFLQKRKPKDYQGADWKSLQENDIRSWYKRTGGHFNIIGGTGALTVEDIEAVCEVYTAVYGIDRPFVLIVDYLQKMDSSKSHNIEKMKIDECVNGLKKITVDYPCTALVISSIPNDKLFQPITIDSFKGSGDIGYGADVALGLQYRNMTRQFIQKRGVYVLESDDEWKNRISKIIDVQKERGRNGKSVELEIYVVKNRLYGTGQRVDLWNLPVYGVFEDYDPLEQPAESSSIPSSFEVEEDDDEE